MESLNKGLKRLNEAHTIYKLYEYHNKPIGGNKYDMFYNDVVSTSVKLGFDEHDLDWFFEWLKGQKHNMLPHQSSGSVDTALRDFDNIISDSDFSQSHFTQLQSYYEYLFFG